MAKKYDPNKKLRRVWRECSNPLKLIISFEDKKGRYILSDPTKTYGRILDMNQKTLFTPIYVLSILRYDPPWYKYTGSQEILRDLLVKVKEIWYTDKNGKEFHIEEYEN